jgi:hypothetical protein
MNDAAEPAVAITGVEAIIDRVNWINWVNSAAPCWCGFGWAREVTQQNFWRTQITGLELTRSVPLGGHRLSQSVVQIFSHKQSEIKTC